MPEFGAAKSALQRLNAAVGVMIAIAVLYIGAGVVEDLKIRIGVAFGHRRNRRQIRLGHFEIVESDYLFPVCSWFGCRLLKQKARAIKVLTQLSL
ncbi:MAG: hypothetical protein P8163_13490 [Candidatus Thiodiazotropha sp.]